MRVSIVHTLKFFSSRFKVYFSRPTFTKLNLGYVRLGYFTLFHFGNKIRGVSVVHTLKSTFFVSSIPNGSRWEVNTLQLLTRILKQVLEMCIPVFSRYAYFLFVVAE